MSGAPAPDPSVAGTDAPSQRLSRDEPTATGRAVIGAGHLDFGPRLRDGRLSLAIHDDRNASPVWRRPADVVIRVRDAASLTAPRSSAYAFLGAAQGKRVYVIPQTQNPKVVWAGWNTQDPAVLDQVSLGASFTFLGVRGPGRLHVFLQAGTGGDPDLLWSSARRGPQPLFVETNTHTHANWVFTAPGVYLVDFEVSAKLRSGRTVRDRQTLHFAVGDATSIAAAARPASRPSAGPSRSADPSPARSASAPAAGSAERADGGAGTGVWLAAGGVVIVVLASVLGVTLQGRSRRRRAQAIIDSRAAAS